MALRVFALIYVLLSWVLLFLSEEVRVKVAGVTSIAETDNNFVCSTLDWWPSSKCDYHHCTWQNAGILNLDLKSKILSNAIKAFDPLRIRVGGSLQDRVVYKVGKVTKCPHFKKRKDDLLGYSPGCLPMNRWDDLNNLFNETGAMVTFSLNALLGRKKSKDDKTLWTGDWAPQNAHDLMAYTVSKGYKIDSYEFGNELSGSGVSARVEAKQYGKDVIVLKELVKELYPDPTTRPKVMGPAGIYDDQKWFIDFLQATGPGVVDGLTYHVYNLGAGDDPTLINKIQDPYFLDNITQTYKVISTTIKSFGPWAGAWVGESGGAYSSGEKYVSHTFVDGFWYLDQLGMTSTYNHKVFCRQAFIGGYYGLINSTTFIPNPDFYSALLWHLLMGKTVLRTTHDSSPYLRVYSHCSKTKWGITLLIINMSNSTAFGVLVVNNSNLYPDQEHKSVEDYDETQQKAREEYHLTPKDGKIQSDVVLLNGIPLVLTVSKDITAMNPMLVDAGKPIHVAPDSIVFANLRGFNAPACA